MAGKQSDRKRAAGKAGVSKAGAVELTEDQLEDAQGGIALLLPAVQQAREAAPGTGEAPLKLNKSAPLTTLDSKTFKV